MSNQRSTFAKRQREQKLKDKAKAKDERRAQKRAGVLVLPDASAVTPDSTDVPSPSPPADAEPGGES